MQNEAIWIIDSDNDDQDVVRQIWKELKLNNELVSLTSADEALDHLRKSESAPFIILCEVNLPGKNGFELREEMLASKSRIFNSVPFIFWSTEASEAQITQAYDLAVHGFFIKEISYAEIKKTFIDIINYWLRSKMPTKKD